MSTLYIRLPSKSAADSAAHWLELACPFALVSRGGSIEREGAAPLPDLSGTVAKTQRVVLLLAASDVTLLRLQVPPLSAARLRVALPNLVEDQLVADPSGCAVVAGGLSDGLRAVAVMQRDWLDFLARTLIASGARRIAALPAQLCLPCQPGSVTAAISEQGICVDMTLHFSEHEGFGLAIAPALSHPDASPFDTSGGSAQGTQSVSKPVLSVAESDEGHEQYGVSAHEAIRTLCAVVPEAPIMLYVPQSAVRAYREAISHTIALNKRIDVFADNWPRWIAGAHGTALDLMAGLGMGASPKLDWRAWRWPLGLAAAFLLINAIALNVDWWRMKSEANSLRATMVQIYKSAYPKETVILDPVAQMRQQIAAAKRNFGLPAPDDFTVILAAFGEAWDSVRLGKTASVIDALEYRERSLFVRLKPVLSQVEGANGEAPTQKMKTALAERNLSLDLVSAQPAVVWKIRSAK